MEKGEKSLFPKPSAKNRVIQCLIHCKSNTMFNNNPPKNIVDPCGDSLLCYIFLVLWIYTWSWLRNLHKKVIEVQCFIQKTFLVDVLGWVPSQHFFHFLHPNYCTVRIHLQCSGWSVAWKPSTEGSWVQCTIFIKAGKRSNTLEKIFKNMSCN